MREVKNNSGLKSTILKWIVLNSFMAYPPLKVHILFYSISLAIRHVFGDITHAKVSNSHKSAILC